MQTPRVILDANVLLSHLLSRDNQSGTINRVLRAAFEGQFTVVLPEALIVELSNTISTKPYFVERIGAAILDEFFADLTSFAEIPAPIESVKRIVRDPHDDYLIACAIASGVDAIVTGDKDLLVLDGEPGELRIVTPVDFLELLESEGRD